MILPSQILKYIFQNYVNSNIDMVSFSLTCKKLYNERNLYICLNGDQLKTNAQLYYKHFKLKGYIKKTYSHFNKIKLNSSNSNSTANDNHEYNSTTTASASDIVNVNIENNRIEFFYDDSLSTVKGNYYLSSFRIFNLDRTFKRNTIGTHRVFDYVPYRVYTPANKDEYLSTILRKDDGITDIEYRGNNAKLVSFRSISCLRTLTHLTLPADFDKPMRMGSLPPHLEYLKIGKAFDQPLEVGVFPPTLKYLIFQHHTKFNRPLLPQLLPEGLIELNIDGSTAFNQILLPKSLPSTLIRLSLGNVYNQSIADYVLPENLIALQIGNSFNQPLTPNTLPRRQLKYLDLGPSFAQSLMYAPSTITHIAMGNSMAKHATSIPLSVYFLSILAVNGHSANKLLKKIPPTISNLLVPPTCRCKFSNIPHSIRRLYFFDSFLHSNKIKSIPQEMQSMSYKESYHSDLIVEVRRLSLKDSNLLIMSEAMFGGMTNNKDISSKIWKAANPGLIDTYELLNY